MLVMLSRNFREITFIFPLYEYSIYSYTRPTYFYINICNIFVSHEFEKISKNFSFTQLSAQITINTIAVYILAK